MGELILFQSLAAGSRTNEASSRRAASLAAALRSDQHPGFFFDLACPFSYIAADRIERLLGDVEWVPVPGDALRDEQPDLEQVKSRAAELARAARLPLIWPEHFPAAVPRAMRAAAYAAENGAGPRLALAAGRLAFGGGFDLERASVLEDVAAAAWLPCDEVRAATAETWRDDELRAMAELLLGEGMTELPVINIGGQWFQGVDALSQAVAWRQSA